MRIIGLAVSLMLLAVLAAPVSAAAFDREHEWYPLNFTIFNDCTGENVEVTGTLHVRQLEHHDSGDDGYHNTFSANYQNVSAVGQLSGDAYRVNLDFEEQR